MGTRAFQELSDQTIWIDLVIPRHFHSCPRLESFASRRQLLQLPLTEIHQPQLNPGQAAAPGSCWSLCLAPSRSCSPALSLRSPGTLTLVPSPTTLHYVHFVKYDDAVSFYDAVSDTIRRRGGDRGIFTEEGVDTVAYFGGNHGSRV